MDTAEDKSTAIISNEAAEENAAADKKKTPLLTKAANGLKAKKALKAVASAGEKRPQRKKAAETEDKGKKDAAKPAKKKAAAETRAKKEPETPAPKTRKAAPLQKELLSLLTFNPEELGPMEEENRTFLPDEIERGIHEIPGTETSRARIEKENMALVTLKMAQNAMQRQTICKGRVVGTEEFRVQINGVMHTRLALTVLSSEFPLKVVIPLELFLSFNPITKDVDLTTEAGRKNFLNRQRQFGDKLIDQDVRFIITDVCGTTAEGFVLCKGDRRSVLAIERNNYFEKRNHVFKVGQDTVAQCLNVGAKDVLVCCKGYEVYINQKNLTNQPFSDMRMYCREGDSLPCKITSIRHVDGKLKVGLDFILGELKAYRRNADLIMSAFYANEEKKAAGLTKSEVQCLGVVSKILTKEEAKVAGGQIIVWIKGYNCPGMIVKTKATKENKKPIAPGDEVCCSVAGMSNMGYVTLYARHKAGTSQARRDGGRAREPGQYGEDYYF